MNAIGQRLTEVLNTLGRPMHTWSGAETKETRSIAGLAKTHTLDALCIGPLDHESGHAIVRFPRQVLATKATGRGSYARTTPDRFGFPRLRRSRAKQHFGYVTGDLVRATVASGQALGRAASLSAPWDNTASRLRGVGSASLTDIYGSYNGATGTATSSGRRQRCQLLEKPVERWPAPT